MSWLSKSNTTYVCFQCMEASRSVTSCPKCKKDMIRLRTKDRVPKYGRKKWDEFKKYLIRDSIYYARMFGALPEPSYRTPETFPELKCPCCSSLLDVSRPFRSIQFRCTSVGQLRRCNQQFDDYMRNVGNELEITGVMDAYQHISEYWEALAPLAALDDF